jgi:hypothetical protein
LGGKIDINYLSASPKPKLLWICEGSLGRKAERGSLRKVNLREDAGPQDEIFTSILEERDEFYRDLYLNDIYYSRF